MRATFYEKNQISRCGMLVGLNAPNKIQRATGVALGEKESISYICSDGCHRVPYLYHNSDGDWNFNLGNFENDWNDDNCLLCFCNSFDFSHCFFVGVFSCRSFFQPPSILPTSSRQSRSFPYLPLSIVSCSHPICSKNLKRSFLPIA